MISKGQVQFLHSLKIKKYRQRYGAFIAEGDKITREAIIADNQSVRAVFALEKWVLQNRDLADKIESVLTSVTEKEMKAISQLMKPADVLCVLEIQADKEMPHEEEISIFLEDVQDPGNVGTIIRISDWFGVKNLFMSEGTADPYNSKVIQSSMGSFLRVRTIRCSFEEYCDAYPEVKIYATDLKGETISKIVLKTPLVLVVGNESKGVSASILESAYKKVQLDRWTDNGAESLNVSVATGLLLSTLKHKIKKTH